MTARTAALAGAAVGAVVVGTDAFRPLLMPRPTLHQAGLTAVGALNGALLGAGAGAVLDRPGRGALTRWAARRPAVPAALAVVGAAVAARAVARLTAATAGRHGPDDPPPPRALPAAAVGWGAAAGVAGTVVGVRRGTRAAGAVLAARTPVPGVVWSGGLRLALLVGAGTALRRARREVRRRFLADGRRVEPGFAAPASALCSGGPGSLVRFADLGREGRRFTSGATPLDVIAEVTGRPAVAEPIRVFVGHDCGPDERERVALAVAELERTGAFERSLLLVQCPAGSGFANATPVDAVELLTAGDVATVAVGYGLLPSLQSMDRLPVATRTQWLLLEEIARRRAARPDRFPRVVLYGESLGAMAQQGVFVDRGTVGLADLGVDAALWVGTPAPAPLPRQLLDAPRADVDPGLVARIDRPEQLDDMLAGEARPRVWLLHHDADPVVLFEPAVAWRRPAWLAPGTAPGRGVPPGLRWRPVMTWWALLVDTVNATNVAPGRFRSSGHDYRADLGAVVRAAYDVGHGVAPEAVEAALRAAEWRRGVLAGEVAPADQPPPG